MTGKTGEPRALARLSPRLRGEAAFLLAVAVLLYLLEAGWRAALAAMLLAWLAVALLEVLRPPRAPAVEADASPPAPILPDGEEHELYVAATPAPFGVTHEAAPAAPEPAPVGASSRPYGDVGAVPR